MNGGVEEQDELHESTDEVFISYTYGNGTKYEGMSKN